VALFLDSGRGTHGFELFAVRPTFRHVGGLPQVPGAGHPPVFSPDSRWLVLALDEGSAVQVLVWRPGLAAPLASPTRVRGPVALAPSIASVT